MLSCIVPAHNEEQLLGQTLRALHEAVAGLEEPAEVIVVNDASTDRTAAIAVAHGAHLLNVEHRQIAATRNAGARAARGDLFLFVDADTIVTRAAVEAALHALRQGAVAGGATIRFSGRLPLYGRVLERVTTPLYRLLGLASGCFLFCTREAFNAAGGFDERLYCAEEAAFSRALKRQGRLVVLRECVTTSGRKLRTHSAREVLGLLARLAWTGVPAIRTRDGLELWYGERRADPGFESEAVVSRRTPKGDYCDATLDEQRLDGLPGRPKRPGL